MIVYSDDEYTNADDLPIGDPYAIFQRPSFMGGYDMLSNQDFSGKGNHFAFPGTYNEFGAVATEGQSIEIPIDESVANTVFLAWNVPASVEPRNLLTTFEASTPRKGMRVTKLGGGAPVTNGQMDVAQATGTTLTSLGFGVAGAWTSRAFLWDSSNMRAITRSGSVVNAALPSRNIGQYKFALNAVPAGRNVGTVTLGFNGTYGFCLVYNEFISESDSIAILSSITSILQGRGIPM